MSFWRLYLVCVHSVHKKHSKCDWACNKQAKLKSTSLLPSVEVARALRWVLQLLRSPSSPGHCEDRAQGSLHVPLLHQAGAILEGVEWRSTWVETERKSKEFDVLRSGRVGEAVISMSVHATNRRRICRTLQGHLPRMLLFIDIYFFIQTRISSLLEGLR